MSEDRSQSSRRRRREIEHVTEDLEQQINSMIEWENIASVSSGDGDAPTADTDDDDDLTVLEPYGFSSRPDGSGTAIALAPGGDTEARVALGVSSPGGRPATDAGDTAMWSVAGHTILLDNDGGITIEAKDGQVIDLDSNGDIILTPKAGSKARLGGGGASQPGAKATITRSEIQTFVTAITAVVPVGADTGALIVAAVTAAFLGGVADLGSSNVELLE